MIHARIEIDPAIMFGKPVIRGTRITVEHISAIYGVDSIELISGTLSRQQQRLVEAWAGLHQGELIEDWERLQSGHLPFKIAPLR